MNHTISCDNIHKNNKIVNNPNPNMTDTTLWLLNTQWQSCPRTCVCVYQFNNLQCCISAWQKSSHTSSVRNNGILRVLFYTMEFPYPGLCVPLVDFSYHGSLIPWTFHTITGLLVPFIVWTIRIFLEVSVGFFHTMNVRQLTALSENNRLCLNHWLHSFSNLDRSR